MPRKNRLNRGWFRKGYDPRRHQLTREERQRGGLTWCARHYMGGAYAEYLGQGDGYGTLALAELADQAGENDRPGRAAAGSLGD